MYRGDAVFACEEDLARAEGQENLYKSFRIGVDSTMFEGIFDIGDKDQRVDHQAWLRLFNNQAYLRRVFDAQFFQFNIVGKELSAIVKDYLDDKFLFIGSNQLMKRFENRGLITYYSPVAFLLWDPQQRFVGDELLIK